MSSSCLCSEVVPNPEQQQGGLKCVRNIMCKRGINLPLSVRRQKKGLLVKDKPRVLEHRGSFRWELPLLDKQKKWLPSAVMRHKIKRSDMTDGREAPAVAIPTPPHLQTLLSVWSQLSLLPLCAKWQQRAHILCISWCACAGEDLCTYLSEEKHTLWLHFKGALYQVIPMYSFAS